MKTFVRLAVALMAITAVCQGSLALAEDYYWVSGGDQAATAVGDPKAPAAKQPAGAYCGQTAGCEPSCGVCEYSCDPRGGVVGLFGFDSFKGISDSLGVSNFGAVTGFNSAFLLPGAAGDRGLGFQLGVTYGAYDWDGRTAPTIGGYLVGVSEAKMQQQTFVTTGFFRKSDEDHPLSFGVVYDWMFNDGWGVFATSPTLGQWRGQAEWAYDESNGVGLYGCVRDLSSTTVLPVGFIAPVAVTTRAVSQVNLFWHHKFEYPAESWLWVGVPQNDRLNGDGSLYAWIFGAALQAPITDNLAWYGNAEYAHPSAAAGAIASTESAWNVSTGILWYFGGGAHTHELNGAKWMPYMPVANNSTFLVDQTP